MAKILVLLVIIAIAAYGLYHMGYLSSYVADGKEDTPVKQKEAFEQPPKVNEFDELPPAIPDDGPLNTPAPTGDPLDYDGDGVPDEVDRDPGNPHIR